MSFSVTALCPACREGYVVYCRTEGRPSTPADYPHCFNCENCGNQIVSQVPANLDPHSIRVKRG